ncbi:MAG: invasion associated locus B family protein [Rhizobiaceae bacterium]
MMTTKRTNTPGAHRFPALPSCAALPRAAAAAAAILLGAGLSCAGGSRSHAAEDSGFRVKPSDVVLPADAELGKYRRVIQPFENWTLICDEDLKKLRKVCNIQQDIMAANGAVVFSWSLAATTQGRPMMILRAPARVGEGRMVTLGFAGAKTFDVKMESCDAQVCTGTAPVGPQLRAHIGEGLTVTVTYRVVEFGTVSLDAPMKGLSAAIAAIQ